VSSGVAAGHIKYGSDLLDRWTAIQPAPKPAAVEDQKEFRSIWFGVAEAHSQPSRRSVSLVPC
jgi:hypothetical protein